MMSKRGNYHWNRAIALAMAVTFVLAWGSSTAYSQAGLSYPLVRVDTDSVNFSGGVYGEAKDPTISSFMARLQDGESLVQDEMYVTSSPTVAVEQGESTFSADMVATSFINTAWGNVNYGPNSTVCISGSMNASTVPPHNYPPQDQHMAGGGYSGSANATGSFKLQSPTANNDPSVRPVLHGALHIILTAPSDPFSLDFQGMYLYWVEPGFHVHAAGSYLDGDYDAASETWTVTGTLQSLDNGSMNVTQYWPSNVNTVALVAEEVIVGNAYPVETELDYSAKGWVYDGESGVSQSFGSLASWFTVKGEDTGPSDFEASFKTNPSDAEVTWRIDTPDWYDP